jgi:hypothetical protein
MAARSVRRSRWTLAGSASVRTRAAREREEVRINDGADGLVAPIVALIPG